MQRGADRAARLGVMTAVPKPALDYTYTFGVDPSIPAGDYSHNDRCGPTPGKPNAIGGTDSCVRISFAASDKTIERGIEILRRIA